MNRWWRLSRGTGGRSSTGAEFRACSASSPRLPPPPPPPPPLLLLLDAEGSWTARVRCQFCARPLPRRCQPTRDLLQGVCQSLVQLTCLSSRVSFSRSFAHSLSFSLSLFPSPILTCLAKITSRFFLCNSFFYFSLIRIPSLSFSLCFFCSSFFVERKKKERKEIK